jgi:RNA recognition motif-containing protein
MVMRRKVFVGNLNYRATEDQLAKFFELAGTIRRVQIARTPEGDSRGCAVIEFDSEENAEIAIDVFDGRQHLGRTLSVREFREAPASAVSPGPGAFDADDMLANGHHHRNPRTGMRGELHDKAREDWRSLRGTKRRV